MSLLKYKNRQVDYYLAVFYLLAPLPIQKSYPLYTSNYNHEVVVARKIICQKMYVKSSSADLRLYGLREISLRTSAPSLRTFA